MSNPHWNKQTAPTRDAATKKIGHYGRGQHDAPKPVHAGAATDKGNAPTSEGKESGGTSFKISKGKVTGSTQGVGAAKKQKYTWI